MKIIRESTKENPIAFFIDFYDNEVIKNWFFSSCFSQYKEDSHVSEYNKGKNENLSDYFIEYWCNIEQDYIKSYLPVELNKYLVIEFKKTLNLIDEMEVRHDIIKARNILSNCLSLEIKTNELWLNIPFLLHHLIDIQNYLNDHILKGMKRNYLGFNNKNELIIFNVFYDLSGVNDDGIKIMRDEDYKRMVSYLKHYLNTLLIVDFGIRIEKLNGFNQKQLRNKFHFFWKQLGNKKKYTQEDMSNILILLFEDFSNTTPEVLKKRLGT